MRWFLLLAVVAALALRCPQLAIRPMHNDEAVNSIKLRDLWQNGAFQYDPHEYHGPTLYYASLVWMKLVGARDFAQWNEVQLRLITVLFGVGLILLLTLLADGLGRHATVFAGFLIAVSPAMVFYSRYFIHEMLLVFFSLLALAAGWRYHQTGKLAWAMTGGAAIGLMYATKETFVLSLVAAIFSLIFNSLLNRCLARAESPFRFNGQHLLAAIALALTVGFILFSSFFTNAQGPLDSFRTYLPNLHRAGGASTHIHPWNFYLERLVWFHTRKGPVWTEAFILALGALGMLASFRLKPLPETHGGFARFLAFYTLALTAIYTVIGYKTPWCLLNFWLGAILLAGIGANTLLNWSRARSWKFVIYLVLLLGISQLAFQAWRIAITYAADTRNPYVYAQTSSDFLKLVTRVNAIAAAQKNPPLVKVMSPEGDYWPLPWYLRGFPEVGWWSAIPADPFAPIMIVSTKFHAELDQKKTHLMVGIFELRPQTFFELYVESEAWRAYLATAKPAED